MSAHRRRFSKPGSSPGLSSLHTDPEQPARLHLIDYTPQELDEVDHPDEQRWGAPIAPGVTRWLDIRGKPGPTLLNKLADGFGLHALALEDVINAGQRSKFEIYGDWFFIIMQISHAGCWRPEAGASQHLPWGQRRDHHAGELARVV